MQKTRNWSCLWGPKSWDSVNFGMTFESDFQSTWWPEKAYQRRVTWDVPVWLNQGASRILWTPAASAKSCLVPKKVDLVFSAKIGLRSKCSTIRDQQFFQGQFQQFTWKVRHVLLHLRPYPKSDSVSSPNEAATTAYGQSTHMVWKFLQSYSLWWIDVSFVNLKSSVVASEAVTIHPQLASVSWLGEPMNRGLNFCWTILGLIDTKSYKQHPGDHTYGINIYPLVNVNKKLWKDPPCSVGKSTINDPCSIAM